MYTSIHFNLVRSTLTAGLVAVAITLAGCTFVKLTPEGKTVDIRANSSTAACKKIGTLSVSGVSKVGFIDRKGSTVSNELTSQARNDAAGMGANVLVPKGEPVDGKQQFVAYSCP